MIDRNTVVEKIKYLLKVPAVSEAIDRSKTVLRARELLADTIEPYRWSDAQLTEYFNDGISEIKNMRSDMDGWSGDIPDAFQSANVNYIVYRALALDNDAQNNNGALSDKFFTIFSSQVNAIKYFFTDLQISKYADDAAAYLVSSRSDLRLNSDGTLKKDVITNERYDFPDRFIDALAYYAAFCGAIHANMDKDAEYMINQYKGAVSTL
jgi:hypothetical protein